MSGRYFQKVRSVVGFREEKTKVEKGLWIEQLHKRNLREKVGPCYPIWHAVIISFAMKKWLTNISSITICPDENFELVKKCLIILHPELKGKIYRFEKTEERKNSIADCTADRMNKEISKIKNVHRNRGLDLEHISSLKLVDPIKDLKEKLEGRAQIGPTESTIMKRWRTTK